MATCCELPPVVETELEIVSPLESARQIRRDDSLLRRQQLQVEGLQNQIRELHSGFVCCLNQLLDLRDLNTGLHSTRLAEWGLLVARSLGVSERDMYGLEMGALLHDIGKVGVPDRILRKPGRLTDEELAAIRRHPELGVQILEHPSLADVRAWVGAHHERPDGLGYPAGISGDALPLEARIVAVADAYEAMTSDRSYRDSIGQVRARAELRRCAGSQFDRRVVEAFLAAVERSAHALVEYDDLPLQLEKPK
jgi:HD-GYP domain-containing protein (c-di-GMP phosphodiesterase class II)